MTQKGNFFNEQPGETTLLSYSGDGRIPDSIYTELEEKINLTDDVKSRKKRFYFIAVECLQNIIRHKEDSTGNGTSHEPIKVMAFAAPGNHYRIVTGNEVNQQNATQLKQQLDQLLLMDSTQLHDYYLSKLNDTTLSEKGGAGLGLIEIARKSENNINYSFQGEGSSSFFSLEVTVK